MASVLNFKEITLKPSPQLATEPFTELVNKNRRGHGFPVQVFIHSMERKKTALLPTLLMHMSPTLLLCGPLLDFSE